MSGCVPKHSDPVHFNRGRHGHCWLCIACERQLSGPKLPDDEREILVEFAKAMRGNGKDLRMKTPKGTTPLVGTEKKDMEQNTMQVSVTLPMMASNEDIAAALRQRAGLFEGMTAKEAGSRANTDAPAPAKKAAKPKSTPLVEEAEESEDEDDDFGSKPAKKASKKAAASFDEDDAEEPAEAEESEDEEEGFDAPPTKKAPAKKAAAKAPKITVDDVNDACKAKAKESDRKTVLAILKKKFKVESVSELKPEQYAAVIEAMTGE